MNRKPYMNCQSCNSPYRHGHNATTGAYEPVDNGRNLLWNRDGHQMIEINRNGKVSHAPNCSGCQATGRHSHDGFTGPFYPPCPICIEAIA